MAQTYTYKDGTGNLATTFPFTFPYIKDTDVKVEVLESNVWETKTKDTHYEFTNATTLKFLSGTLNGVTFGAPADSENNIRISRDTGADKLIATFYPGSAIRSTDLNDNFTQNLHATEEAKETAAAAFQIDGSSVMTGDMNLGKDVDIFFEGSAANDYETKLTVTNPTQDNTITLPNRTGTVVTTGDTGSVTSTMITDGTIVNDDVNTSAAIAGSKLAAATTSSPGSMSAADKAKLDGIEALATADQSDEEIQDIVGAMVSGNTETGIEVTYNDSTDRLDFVVASQTDQNFTNADHTKLDGIEDNAKNTTAANIRTLLAVTGQGLTAAHLEASSVDNSELAPNAVHEASIKDGEVTIAKLGCKQTAVTNSDSYVPTSAAVIKKISDTLAEAGSFEAIEHKYGFPATHPDPNATASVAGIAGMVVSIQDADGLSINSSGVATNARKGGTGSDNITINNFPNSMRGGVGDNADPYILSDETGLLVTTTLQTDTEYTNGATYDFHRVTVKPADYVQLSDDIDDFNSRYRIATDASGVRTGKCGTNGTGTGSFPCEGDMCWFSGSGKMHIFDAISDFNAADSATKDGCWKVVTSTGDYKLLTVKDHNQLVGGSGPTFNGSNEEFDLFDGSSDASIDSAGQLIVSLNGVIQKPNNGTFSGSEEGFYLNDTHGIKFCDPPASGSSLFVTQIGTATALNVPADGSITRHEMFAAGVVTSAKLETNINLAGTLDVTGAATLDGGLTVGNNFTITDASDGGGGYNAILTQSGDGTLTLRGKAFYLQDSANSNQKWLKCNTAAGTELHYANSKKLETTTDGAVVTGKLGIGTASPAEALHIHSTTTGGAAIELSENAGSAYQGLIQMRGNDMEIRGSSGQMEFYTGNADGASSTQRLAISNTGAATFAGNVDIAGYIKKNTSAGALCTYIGDTYLRVYSSPSSLDDFKISLENTGAATFTSTIQSKGNPMNGAAEGSQLAGDSGVIACSNTGSQKIWRGFQGSNATATSSITAAGAATFAGPLNVGNELNAGSGVNIYGGGSIYIRQTGTGSADKLLIIQNDNSTEVANLNGGGGATFASTVLSGADPYTSQSNVGQRMDPTSGIVARSSGSNQLWTGYATGSGDVTSEIKASGVATFASVFADYTQCNRTTSGNYLWIGQLSGSNTSTITAAGNATFAGNTVIGSTTAANHALKVYEATYGEWTAKLENGDTSAPHGLWINYSGAAPNGSSSSFITCNDTSSTKFQILSNGDVQSASNSYGSTSDVKLKQDIVDASSQWNDIKAIKVRNFKFKTDTTKTLLGVVAQEVETVSPGLVYESPDLDSEGKPTEEKTKGVKYSILYMKAIKALQEAMTKIETLEIKVAALEAA